MSSPISTVSAPAVPATPSSTSLTQAQAQQAQTSWTIEAVSEGGERVTHLYEDDCYRAHLSIYQFAANLCQGAQVLDAGSGAGYGSAYLASHGAAFVHGVDNGEAAVAFSQDHFQLPNLAFHQADLADLDRLGFAPGSFDVIFSSNALEHVADVAAFLRTASRLLKPGGSAIIAVPPITNDYLRAGNIANPYHLNIWSPRQWDHVLADYFAGREYYLHCLGQSGVIMDFTQPAPQPVPSEAWKFLPATLAEMSTIPTLTAVFVARSPKPTPTTTPIQFVDESFTRPEHDRVVDLMASLIAARESQTHNQLAGAHQAAQQYQLQVQHMARTLAEKEQQISHQQDYIRRVDSGFVLRTINQIRRTFRL